MSAIRDITSIDLSNMNTLEGKRSIEVVVETITNLNPLTPLPILPLFRPAGTLDVLANCKNLKVLNCSSSDWTKPMKITGTRAIANLKR